MSDKSKYIGWVNETELAILETKIKALELQLEGIQKELTAAIDIITEHNNVNGKEAKVWIKKLVKLG